MGLEPPRLSPEPFLILNIYKLLLDVKLKNIEGKGQLITNDYQ